MPQLTKLIISIKGETFRHIRLEVSFLFCIFAQSFQTTKESGYTDAELLAIDKYWDQISRERTALNAAERKGEARGRAEGVKQTNRTNAKSMKALGVDISIISQVTGLSPEEINSL